MKLSSPSTDQSKKCNYFIEIFLSLPVVDQDYTVRVDDGVAVRGNTAVLRCHIPGLATNSITFC